MLITKDGIAKEISFTKEISELDGMKKMVRSPHHALMVLGETLILITSQVYMVKLKKI